MPLQFGLFTLSLVTLTSLSTHIVQGAPLESDWAALNASVGGRLFSAEPFARPCFSVWEGQPVTPDAAQCAVIQDNYFNGSYRTNFYSGFMHSYNEECASNVTDQCDLSDTDAVTGLASGSCNQGSVSERYISVAGPADVQAALEFSFRTGVRLSVKASGHDYGSRSSLKGSLALWTRNLRDMSYEPRFVPSGATSAAMTKPPVRAITVGAGANLGEIYAFCHAHNITFVGGSAETPAAAGGWSLLGGHSVLTPLYGLGADRALEFTLVTPDSVLRTANAAINPDLFWALRGAGSASFGVVLSATFLVEPAMPLTLALMQFNTTTTTAGDFLRLLVNQAASWAVDGWGGPMTPGAVALVTPLLDVDAARRSMESVAEFVTEQGGTVLITRLKSFYELYTKYFKATTSPGYASATFASMRVIPKSLHHSAAGRASIQETLMALSDATLTPYIFQTAPASYSYNNSDPSQANAVHSAWRDSYWVMGTEVTWPWDADLATRNSTAALLQEASRNLTALAPAPGGSMYPNLADPWVEGWQREFWGEEKYARLLEIKNRYDPRGLLGCRRCVGFDDSTVATDPAYQCLDAFQGARRSSVNI
jgi:FAD/FMN-containing dehydrogenase